VLVIDLQDHVVEILDARTRREAAPPKRRRARLDAADSSCSLVETAAGRSTVLRIQPLSNDLDLWFRDPDTAVTSADPHPLDEALLRQAVKAPVGDTGCDRGLGDCEESVRIVVGEKIPRAPLGF
jgi:hypothetical protein